MLATPFVSVHSDQVAGINVGVSCIPDADPHDRTANRKLVAEAKAVVDSQDLSMCNLFESW